LRKRKKRSRRKLKLQKRLRELKLRKCPRLPPPNRDGSSSGTSSSRTFRLQDASQ